jgi:hypothetical protein
VFLWEWFTTKPYVDSGEVRFIGSVYSGSLCLNFDLDGALCPAPWPCWSIAASPSAHADTLNTFLSSLEPYVTKFNSAEARQKDDVDFVTGYFGHQREDVVEWLKTVRWEDGLRKVEEKVVRDTLACVSFSTTFAHWLTCQSAGEGWGRQAERVWMESGHFRPYGCGTDRLISMQPPIPISFCASCHVRCQGERDSQHEGSLKHTGTYADSLPRRRTAARLTLHHRRTKG